jgi:DNA-binding transcriptional LysR family regulator
MRVFFELRHLRYVVAAAEHGSFRKAALALGVQESAVSRRIRDLEDEIGATLFVRHHAGVCPTYAGHQFVGRARKAINQLSYAARDVGLIGRAEKGVVRLGIFSSLASGFLAELLQTYGAKHSGVRLEIVEGGPSDHVPAIRQHRLDVAFLTGPPQAADCDALHLWSERVYVAMSKADVLAGKDEVAWGDLQGRAFVVSEAPPGPEIYDYLVKHLADLGASPDIERQAVYRDTLMQIVAVGRKLTLTSEATIAAQFPGVTYRPLIGETLPFCAIWSPRNDNPAFRRLLSLARIMSRRCAGYPVKKECLNPSSPPGCLDATSRTPCPSP